MKILVGFLVALLVLLQYQLWLSDEGLREVWQLRQAVAVQQADNQVLLERNAQLKAEVADLKQGLTALEERARHDLGMVAVSETFYQVVDAPPQPGAAPRRESLVTQASD
ncbi:MAG: cell division protein FtsB [Gammaproteobacteria bacterium]|nr:cell division protein FtsB [Gammaproteobacteria bacterium]